MPPSLISLVMWGPQAPNQKQIHLATYKTNPAHADIYTTSTGREKHLGMWKQIQNLILLIQKMRCLYFAFHLSTNGPQITEWSPYHYRVLGPPRPHITIVLGAAGPHSSSDMSDMGGLISRGHRNGTEQFLFYEMELACTTGMHAILPIASCWT